VGWGAGRPGASNVVRTAGGLLPSSASPPAKFLALTLLLSLPFWLLAAVSGTRLSSDLPAGAPMAAGPLLAAIRPTHEEDGAGRVTRLLW
jgi:hypothetical protein